MIHAIEINSRFLSFYPGKRQHEIADLLGVSRSTVSQWVIGVRQIPWKRLKLLVDSEQITWDWLLEGREPKYREWQKDTGSGEMGVFELPAINQRFLSLYSGITQKQLAAVLDICHTEVSSWKVFTRQVPWDILKKAVEKEGVTWEWILEGRDPKYR